MKRIIMIAVLALSCGIAHAQWYYQYRLGNDGNMSLQSAGPFALKSECEASRNAILSQKGLDFSDVVAGGASLSWNATPCTGRGTSGITGNMSDLNNYHLLGVDQGQASFINNPGQDIEQWYKEWQRKHDIIVPAPHSSGLLLVSTGDSEFDKGYVMSVQSAMNNNMLLTEKETIVTVQMPSNRTVHNLSDEDYKEIIETYKDYILQQITQLQKENDNLNNEVKHLDSYIKFAEKEYSNIERKLARYVFMRDYHAILDQQKHAINENPHLSDENIYIVSATVSKFLYGKEVLKDPNEYFEQEIKDKEQELQWLHH